MYSGTEAPEEVVFIHHERPLRNCFGPPVPVPAKNRARTLRRGRFMGTGTGFRGVSVFQRALRVMGFPAITSVSIRKTPGLLFVLFFRLLFKLAGQPKKGHISKVDHLEKYKYLKKYAYILKSSPNMGITSNARHK